MKPLIIIWSLAIGTILLIALLLAIVATVAYGVRGYESLSVIFGILAAVALVGCFVGFIIGDEEL